MSKLKTPREKKLASLALDRRNSYGENDKASRKLIPRSKQRSHQTSRRAAREPLLGLTSAMPDDEVAAAENIVLTREIRGGRSNFRKQPDVPLATHIENKAYWAQRRADETEYWKARRHPSPAGNPAS